MSAPPIVVLVGCSRPKLTMPAPARLLYTSPLFRAARAYAELVGDAWHIVSGRHGLVDPDQVLAPYEYDLSKAPVRDRDAWADRVAAELRYHHYGAHYVLLAGGVYAAHLAAEFQLAMSPAALSIKGSVASVELPLDGLNIGQRLKWLNQQVGAA